MRHQQRHAAGRRRGPGGRGVALEQRVLRLGIQRRRRLVEEDELDSRRQALASALCVLNNRERRIFEARRLSEEPTTLKELADEFGVSRERVRQIDVSSFVKVQKMVKSRGYVMEEVRADRSVTMGMS